MTARMAKRPMRQRVALELEGDARITASAVVLTRCRFQCTYCGAWKDSSDFGLRVMRDKVIRNQPRCAPCRRHLGAGMVDSTPKAIRRRARAVRQLELELEDGAVQ